MPWELAADGDGHLAAQPSLDVGAAAPRRPARGTRCRPTTRTGSASCSWPRRRSVKRPSISTPRSWRSCARPSAPASISPSRTAAISKICRPSGMASKTRSTPCTSPVMGSAAPSRSSPSKTPTARAEDVDLNRLAAAFAARRPSLLVPVGLPHRRERPVASICWRSALSAPACRRFWPGPTRSMTATPAPLPPNSTGRRPCAELRSRPPGPWPVFCC